MECEFKKVTINNLNKLDVLKIQKVYCVTASRGKIQE